MSRLRHAGLSLIELMVAMTIGLFLIAAAGSVYLTSQSTYRTSDAVSRLQENARFALRVVATDLQMAGFLGNSAKPGMIEGRRGTSGQLDALPAMGAGDCAPRWYIDMTTPFVIGNNSAPVIEGTSTLDTCLKNKNLVPQSDVIAVKHASGSEIDPADISTQHSNWTLIRTDPMHGALYVGGGAQPAGLPASGVTTDRRWLAHVYYVAFDVNTNLPALRRLQLGSSSSGPAMWDKSEVVSGIQDIQVQLGIDTDDDGVANRFVEPGSEGGAQVVAARIWVLARSETREPGHDDSINTYIYANKRYIPGDSSTDNDTEFEAEPTQFRRLLLSTTVDLRNL